LADITCRAKKLDDFLKNQGHTESEKQHESAKIWPSETSCLRQIRTIDKPGDNTIVKIFGKGAFGEVKLVSHRTTGKVYALQCFVKAGILIEGNVKNNHEFEGNADDECRLIGKCWRVSRLPIWISQRATVSTIFEKDQLANVRAERDILAFANSELTSPIKFSVATITKQVPLVNTHQ